MWVFRDAEAAHSGFERQGTWAQVALELTSAARVRVTFDLFAL